MDVCRSWGEGSQAAFLQGLMGGGTFRQSEGGIICDERAHRRGGSQFLLGSGDKEDFSDERSFEVGFEGRIGVCRAERVGNKQVEL